MIPTLGAAYAHNTIGNLHSTGVDLLNIGRIGVTIAHLYTACKSSGLLSESWQDMAYFIEAQGASSLGLLDVSHTPRQALAVAKSFGLAMGVKAHQYVGSKA